MKALILYLALALVAFAAPDLTRITVANRAAPLTNARVLSVTIRGITFACDQGIVQVPFEALPAEFAEYRARIKDAPVVAAKPVLVTPPKAPVVTSPKKAEKTALQQAREAKDRAQLVSHHRELIRQAESLISRYDKQTLIGNPNPISTEDYNVAKATVEDSRAKLAELTK